jgi:hypothetical protein
MTYACPTWEFAAETYRLKLQQLQNKILLTIGDFPRCASVRDMHVAFYIQYIYDYITKFMQTTDNKSFKIMKMKTFASHYRVKGSTTHQIQEA